MGPPGIEEACEEIIALRYANGELAQAYDGAKQALEVLAVECAFWKRAAEQALRLWERAEEEAESRELEARARVWED